MNAILMSIVAALVLTACAAATTAPPVRTLTAQPTDIPSGSPLALAPTVAPSTETTKLLPEEPVPFNTGEWRTDFKKHTVPFREIFSGGPPKDGIPALDEPRFISTGDASAWLKDNEPVILFQHKEDVRAYPLQILIWHEIVNDTVGGLPVVITFCPLCNSSIVFARTVAGTATTFGTTGNCSPKSGSSTTRWRAKPLWCFGKAALARRSTAVRWRPAATLARPACSVGTYTTRP
ncbi:MAG: hypothetical protein A2Z03_11730 [Chloroflexi bacterium RBG_16_56_8]|nr:MAG: hypothetical protein A2Z03_11730 [Chloroflexi bacterium RBG_16_56_8]